MTQKFENSTLNGKNRNKYHSSSCIYEPTCRHPSSGFLPIGSEVPLVKKSSFPPGEAKRRLRELIPFNVPIHSGNGGLLKIPIIYKLFTHAIVLGVGELTKRLKTAVFSGMITLNIFRRNTAW